MKTLLYFLILLICFAAKAQDFKGTYTAEGTSFKDNFKPENNFRENSKFNIAVIFENSDKGRVAIQDPRIPEKILIYEIQKFLEKIEQNKISYHIYQAQSLHTINPIKTQLVFYRKTDGELNLMVSDDESSQLFRSLKIKK